MHPDSTTSTVEIVGAGRYELPAKVAIDAVRGSLALKFPLADVEWDVTHVRLTRKHVLVLVRGVDPQVLAGALAVGFESAELWEGVDGTGHVNGVAGYLAGQTFDAHDGREVA